MRADKLNMGKTPRRLNRRRFLKMATGAFASLGAYSFHIEPNWIETTLTRVPIRGLPNLFNGYRIGLVADTHYPQNIEHSFLGLVGEALRAANVDLIVMPGDIVDDSCGPKVDLTGVFDHFLAPDGQFATLGNHDHWFGAAKVRHQIKQNTPFTLLENDRVFLNRGDESIALAGVDDLTDGQIDVAKALGGLDPKIPCILLSHNPDLAHDLEPGYRVDLQLSGHMHGGQVNLFGYAPITPSKYGQTFVRGLVQGRSHPVYVTRGLCRTKLHVRFNSRPEVSVIELIAANS
jgi:predicted MPP superfamily phosphohydrolase